MLSHLKVYGANYFSYKTMIRQSFGGLTIGNVTQYRNDKGYPSQTSLRHMRLACVHSCDILLDNVPEGTGDLLSLAVNRGMVWVKGNEAGVIDKPEFPDGEFPNVSDMEVYQ